MKQDQKKENSSDTNNPNDVRKEINTLPSRQRDILIILYKLEEPTGKEIKDELEEYYWQDVSHAMYNHLIKLEEKGLIDETSDKHSRSNKYSLTEKGKELIRVIREYKDKQMENINSVN